MADSMLIITFFLGVVLILVGTVAFIARLLGRSTATEGGLTIRIGKWLSLDTPRASLAFLGLGLFLLLSGLSGAITVQAQGAKLEKRNDFIQSSTPVIAAISRIPPEDIPKSTQANGSSTSTDEYQRLQNRAFDSLGILIQDEVLALTVLDSLSENTFGLAKIPKENAERFSNLLESVTSRFPENIALQIQAADLYRSLYESTKAEKYQEAWGRLARESIAKDGLEERQRFQAHQLLGLYLTSKDSYEEALDHLKKARQAAPETELYKIEYNLCNTYLLADDFEQAEPHCRESRRLADEEDVVFWPSTFFLAIIEQKRGDYAKASDFFIQCLEMARVKAEVDLLMSYVPSNVESVKLCEFRGFKEHFPTLCDELPNEE